MKRLLLSALVISAFSLVSADEVTFNQHIAPLVHQNCSKCHRPGESAPFDLLTYKDVSRRSRTILRVVEDRYMPPWHADVEQASFDYQDVRRLSDQEIELFAQWVEGGKLEGDPSQKPELPVFPEGWQLGEPDLVVTMPKSYNVPADGRDIYRNFVIPLNLPEDKWVKAVELRPSARSVVHHSLFFLDDTGTAQKMDGRDGQPGFRGMAFRRSGSLGGYVPGVTATKLPEDFALPLPKGSDFILSTHFHPSGKAEVEKTTVGFFFADKPPSRPVRPIQIPAFFGRTAGIDIPAGEKNFKIEDTFTIPVDAEAIKVGGHAHYICSEMTLTATFPDGSVKTLLHIDDWDLDWQDSYLFKERVLLPAGTVLKSVIYYDNSAENSDNPFSPPRRIKWGHESTDEMGSITLLVTHAKGADGARLRLSTAKKKAGVGIELIGELRERGLAEKLPLIVERLDINGDGDLQESELPKRMRKSLLRKLDADKDGALDPSEIQTLRDWLKSLREQDNEKDTV